jgi:hypothetical protein
MADRSLALILLSLFTSLERAASIEGDLIEQRPEHGRTWFAVHVAGTTIALFGRAFMRAPFRTAAFVLGAWLSVFAVSWIVRALFLWPGAPIDAPLIGLGLAMVSTLMIGAGLARAAPVLGVRAAAGAAAIMLVGFIAAQIMSWSEQFVADAAASGPSVATVNALVLAAGNLLLSISIYLIPLLAGSICTYSRLRR